MAGPPWLFVDAAQGANGPASFLLTSKLTKTGGAAGTWDSGARSVQTFAADVFLEETVAETGKYRTIGLSAEGAQSITFETVDYAVSFKGGGTPTQFGILESGSERTTGTYAVGDCFRIERIGTQVRYFKNGELIWTSAVPSAGVLMVDSAFFDSAAILDGIRTFIPASLAWQSLTWTTTNVTAALGTTATLRKISLVPPAKVRAGDQLVAILASQGTEYVVDTDVEWPLASTFTTTGRRQFSVLRREVTNDEPLAFMIDLAVTQETIGILLVYRGLDNTLAMVAASGTDHTSQTSFVCPSRALVRYSDLYIGLVYELPSVGDVTAPADCSERIEFTQSALGFYTVRLEAFDFRANAVGATDVKTATVASASGVAASIALAGLLAKGIDLGFAPVVMGAIGLPTEGI